MRNEIRKSILLAILFLVILFIVGTFGYKFIEGWNFFDSIYMTVITLATVGYGETNPLTFSGRVFTIILIIFGITTFVYAISRLQSFFIEGELTGILRRRKMENKIKNLKDLPSSSLESHQLSQDLKKRGFKFIGPKIVYAYMQAVGMVNDHFVTCFRYKDLKNY